MAHADASIWLDAQLLPAALKDTLRKLSPRAQLRNPVMAVVYLGAVLTSLLWLQRLQTPGASDAGFTLAISLWLWFTVLFANFAEALAEGRSRAQASSLRGMKRDTMAKVLRQPAHGAPWIPMRASELGRGMHILVEAGEFIALDGVVVQGVASVDESAITGESAPVIREAGGDFSSVTGGTRVLSDWLVIEISVNPGESFLDRMIGMVESAKRQKTPNELALTILLVGLTLVFLLVIVTLLPFSMFAVAQAGSGQVVGMAVLIALLVCLIPTTIGGLLSAIGVAGMSRMMRANVIATSGRAVEAAGDVDVLLMDKTGTITWGNRQARDLLVAPGIADRELAEAALLASWADETPEGRSVVALAQERHGMQAGAAEQADAEFVSFSAQTRMSGVNLPGPRHDTPRQVRKGAADAVRAHVLGLGGHWPQAVQATVDAVSRKGSTPLVVADGLRVLGVVALQDIVKPGLRERFAELRRMGIQTVMVTGDNPLTAAAIAAEAGVDDYLAEAKPEDKLQLIRSHQAAGRLVAMTGDGTNDAPALAQADVAVAMNSGTQAAKEAANMVDLDSNPTKLIEVVETGKQMLMTRGALTTFSVANDVAKYFAIIPAAFVGTYPELARLNVMQLHSADSAILSAIVFNALIIVALIPLALRGVRYRAVGAAALLRRNLLVYGLGGLLVPFVGIKLIDLLLVAMAWV